MPELEHEPDFSLENKSKWALAHILQGWKYTAGPLARKAYGRSSVEPTDPELCDQLAERMEGYGRAAREAARLAREEQGAFKLPV